MWRDSIVTFAVDQMGNIDSLKVGKGCNVIILTTYIHRDKKVKKYLLMK